jgi:hypothetical protein
MQITWGTRTGEQYVYLEGQGLNAQTGGPRQNDPIVGGWLQVPKKTKTLTCDWRFLPLGFVRNSLNNAANLDACLGTVNSTTFVTPKGSFLRGTCLLMHYKVTYEISPIQLPGLQVWALQVQERVHMSFSIFDTTSLKNATIVPTADGKFPAQGHNLFFHTDGNWYLGGSKPSSGNPGGTPPMPYREHQLIFQQAQ